MSYKKDRSCGRSIQYDIQYDFLLVPVAYPNFLGLKVFF